MELSVLNGIRNLRDASYNSTLNHMNPHSLTAFSIF